MTQFIQKGERIDYVNSSENTIKYLDLVPGTDKLFVAAEEIAPGAVGAVYGEGVFEFTTADTEAITFGQKIYYSATSGITAAASETSGEGQSAVTTDNVFVGYAVKPAAAIASGEKAVLVKLG